MKFYLVLHIVAPLFLIGLTLWAIETPGLELSEVGPLILVALGAYAIWHVARLIRWGGFHVVVTGEDITVGGTRVAWRDVSGVTVQTAFKFDTWIEIRPRTGEPLRIPAAIGKKNQLLTLVEKHHPDLERKT